MFYNVQILTAGKFEIYGNICFAIKTHANLAMWYLASSFEKLFLKIMEDDFVLKFIGTIKLP